MPSFVLSNASGFLLIICLTGSFALAQEVPVSAKPATLQQEGKIAAAKEKEAPARMSQKEADELFKSIDEIMRFVSRDTGLALHHDIKKELIGRDEVQKYIEEKMKDDEDRKDMERSEVVLKKFGLLPREFQLQTFLVSLLREQIAAFYDSKKKTVFMLNWLSPESQKPIMAHELTHALQDQTVDMDKWIEEVRKKSKQSSDPDRPDIEVDEESSARSAVAEGQGMAVLIDYLLAPMGRTMQDSPQVVDMMRAGMDKDDSAPLLASAPLLLRESLIFPYRDGLGFVQAVLSNGGVDKAYTNLLLNPPHNTHEVLVPDSYLKGEHIGHMRLPNIKKALSKDYRQYDVGSIGHFDTIILLKQLAEPQVAKDLSADWRGGIYYAGAKNVINGKKVDKETILKSTKDIALLYVSKWASADSAKQFAGIYSDGLKKKYSKVETVKDRTGAFVTEEGIIHVEVIGNSVLVIESMDDALADKIRKLVVASLESDKGTTTTQNDLGIHAMAPMRAILRDVMVKVQLNSVGIQ